MKKNLKKLSLNTEVVRSLASPSLRQAAGGISGALNCNTLRAECGGGPEPTEGATCTSGGVCHTGLMSACGC